ncbi:MAG TPA: Ig-like domain-containing protein [Candidatus Limnocylindria bacterium]|nr:Ig-like domain-containing protein [Candidatus Limnocylindria bacterium]
MIQLNTNSGSFTYTPAHGYFGPDNFTFVANDGQTNSEPASVWLYIHDPWDADYDGMDDIWENFWDINNPFGDPDGDGFSTLEEYLANTSPRNAQSVLRVLKLAVNVDRSVTLAWQSVGGTRYRVQSADVLSSGPSNFLDIVRPITEEMDSSPIGTASTQTFIDLRDSPVSGQRFYRIQSIVQ